MHQPARNHRHHGHTAGSVPPGRTSLLLASTLNAPAQARRYVTGVLHAFHAPRALTETAELITSELVTNSVKYGRARLVRVTVRTTAAAVTITVSAPTPYVPLPEPGLAADDDENGRGLFLVAALADRWGHHPTGPGRRPGTAVWAQLRRPRAD